MSTEHLKRAVPVSVLLLGMILRAVGFAAQAEAPEGATGRESGTASGALFSDFPLYFVENRGQVAEGVAFYLEGRETSVYFTPQGLTYALTGSAAHGSPEQRPLNAAARAVSYAAPGGPAEAVSRWAVKLDFGPTNGRTEGDKDGRGRTEEEGRGQSPKPR